MIHKLAPKKIPYVLAPLLVISLIVNIFFLITNAQRTIVVSVPDGDSLQLSDGRRIRLLGLDSPERDECFSQEAQQYLSGSTLTKRVHLEDIVTDDYGRQLANVFVGNAHINRELVSGGFSRFTHVKSPHSEQLKIDQSTAKTNKIGIWSEACRSTVSANPDCTIKGNSKAGNKTYHLPICHNYDQTIIDTSFGDRWFCTEKEAVAAGFEKATGCPK